MHLARHLTVVGLIVVFSFALLATPAAAAPGGGNIEFPGMA